MSDVQKALAELEAETESRIAGDRETVHGILHRHTVLVAREVEVDNSRREAKRIGCGDLWNEEHARTAARNLFPLMSKLLREEPVPGQQWPLYRVRNGKAEYTENLSPARWLPLTGFFADSPALLRHLLDLHDNPFREVPE